MLSLCLTFFRTLSSVFRFAPAGGRARFQVVDDAVSIVRGRFSSLVITQCVQFKTYLSSVVAAFDVQLDEWHYSHWSAAVRQLCVLVLQLSS